MYEWLHPHIFEHWYFQNIRSWHEWVELELAYSINTVHDVQWMECAAWYHTSNVGVWRGFNKTPPPSIRDTIVCCGKDRTGHTDWLVRYRYMTGRMNLLQAVDWISLSLSVSYITCTYVCQVNWHWNNESTSTPIPNQTSARKVRARMYVCRMSGILDSECAMLHFQWQSSSQWMVWYGTVRVASTNVHHCM